MSFSGVWSSSVWMLFILRMHLQFPRDFLSLSLLHYINVLNNNNNSANSDDISEGIRQKMCI